MNNARCHRCGCQIPLESAIPRGAQYPGFICARCNRRGLGCALIVIISATLVIILAIICKLLRS